MHRIPATAQKLAQLYPSVTVLKNFLSPIEMEEVRRFFCENEDQFHLRTDGPGEVHPNCHLRQMIVPGQKLMFIRDRFEKAFIELSKKENVSSVPVLKFDDTLYAKFYSQDDFYNPHVDQSPSGLTFLFQFSLTVDSGIIGPLTIDGLRDVPFESNQLIIFHSFLLHHFKHNQGESKKAILQLLPGI